MAYSSYKATKAQWGYFRSLTGDSLPSGCSKSTASSLIAKALKGEYVKKKDVVRVYGYVFSGLAAECLKENPVRYTVDLNYRLDKTGFATLADAEAYARSAYPNAEIEVSNSIRQQYID